MLLAIGWLSGIITGMLSLGGGIVLIFLLMFIPPLFHFPLFSMHEIGGMVTVQSIFSMLSGSVVYLRQRLFDVETVYFMGGGGLVGSIAGAYMVGGIDNQVLVILYTCMCSLAAVLMFIPRRESTVVAHQESNYSLAPRTFWRRVWKFAMGAVIAFAGAMLGVTAGFIMVPLLLYVYKFPIKITVGTVIMIGLLVAIGSLLGRVIHHSFPMLASVALIVGAIPGGYMGGLLTRGLNNLVLKRLAAAMVLLLTIRVLSSALATFHMI